jgi:hypothetical protein
MRLFSWKAAILALAALGLQGSNARAELIYGITTATNGQFVGANLVNFDSANPGAVSVVAPLSGALPNHAVRSIDFRPNGGALYAISTDTTSLATAQVYTVNPSTGVLTPQGGTFTLTGNTNSGVMIDFNPVADRLRITTIGSTNNNYRWNPVTNAFVQQDTNFAFPAAGDPNSGQTNINVTGTAYSNNVPGATSTTLYGWEYQRDTLLTIGSVGGSPNSPNSGILSTVFTPGTFRTTLANIGMDISGNTGICYVSHDDPNTGAPHSLFTLDLATGTQTSLGTFGSTLIADVAVVPEPTSMVLCGMGAGAFALRTWRKRKASV